jgi:site-specific DNA recombinase
MRVALYCRVSTDEQKEGHTIDSQVRALELFAQTHGYRIVETYTDQGWSGALLNRPALDQLRDAAVNHCFEAVLVHDVDRLSRDLMNLAVIKRDLERNAVRLIFRNLPTDDSPMSHFMVNILGSYAELERIMLGDRFRRGKRFKAEERKLVVGNKPPYGYNYVKKDKEARREGYYALNQDEAEVVRLIYRWVDDEQLSERAVTRRLIELKMAARHTRWSKATVHRILTDEIYTGVTYYNKTCRIEPTRKGRIGHYQKTPKTSRRRRPRSEWIAIPLPPDLQMIERDQFERVQKQLARNGAFSPRNIKYFYLLRQVRRVCAACGASFTGCPSSGRTFYRCSNYYALPDRPACKAKWIGAQRVESAIWTELRKLLQNPVLILGNLEKLQQKRRVQRAAAEDACAEARQRLKSLEQEEDRLIGIYRRGLINVRQFEREVKQVRAAREVAEQALPTAPQEQEGALPADRGRELTEYCRLVVERFDTLTPAERQQLLGYLITEIIFDTDRGRGDRVSVRGEIPLWGGGDRAALGSNLRSERNVREILGDIAPGSNLRSERNASVPFAFNLTWPACLSGSPRKASNSSAGEDQTQGEALGAAA